MALSIGAMLVISVIVIVVVFGLTGRGSTTSSAQRPRTTVPLGVFRQTSAAQVAGFQAWLGAPVSYVVDFSARDTWNDLAQPDYLLQQWQQTNYRLVLAVPMLPSNEQASMSAGASGAYDGYFGALAEHLVQHGERNAILRIGWEFNLQSWPWSIEDEVTFKTFYRHIVAAMRAVPGQTFQFDWNVNNGENAYDAVWYYPGDDVVDYVGIDAYDNTGAVYPYPNNCDAGCRTATQNRAWDTQIYGGARGLKFWSGFAAQHRKPVSIPEWGLWDRPDGTGGGDDPTFIRRMHDFIADPANRVGYQAYFEANGQDGNHSLVDSFPAAAKEFRLLFGGRT